jgi:choline dehydrogenase
MLRLSLTYVLLCSLLVTSIYAKRKFNPDFIFVGGGTAASVAAARLSEDPKISVLVIEEGQDRSDVVADLVGFWGGPFSDFKYARDFGGKPAYARPHYSQEDFNGYRSLYYPAPSIAGGGASINGGAFGCLSRADYAHWNVTGWAFDDIIADRMAIEDYMDCHTIGCNTSVHGTGGPIKVTNYQPDSYLLEVKNSVANVFGLSDNDDMNGGDVLGIGRLPRNIYADQNGVHRQDGYLKMLKPALGRPNLDLITGARVLKIDLRKNGKHEVIYVDESSEIVTIRAKKEVIVSAGVIESPHILLNSGVGNCTELAEHDIPCVVNNPHVGKYFRDSYASGLMYTLIPGVTPPTPANGTIYVGYYNSPGYNGPVPNVEIGVTNFVMFGRYNVFLMMALGVHDEVGKLQLKSGHPTDAPRLTFNMFSNPTTVFGLVDQFKKFRQSMAAINNPPRYIEVTPGFNVVPPGATDLQIAAYLMGVANPIYHAVGTCAIKKVVDERLRLIDVNGKVIPGIRVVDNSIIPELMSVHATSCTAMWTGSVASRLIKEDHYS